MALTAPFLIVFAYFPFMQSTHLFAPTDPIGHPRGVGRYAPELVEAAEVHDILHDATAHLLVGERDAEEVGERLHVLDRLGHHLVDRKSVV